MKTTSNTLRFRCGSKICACTYSEVFPGTPISNLGQGRRSVRLSGINCQSCLPSRKASSLMLTSRISTVTLTNSTWWLHFLCHSRSGLHNKRKSTLPTQQTWTALCNQHLSEKICRRKNIPISSMLSPCQSKVRMKHRSRAIYLRFRWLRMLQLT